MNIWRQPFPKSMDLLLAQCNESVDNLINKLAVNECHSLSDIYSFDIQTNKVRLKSKAYSELKSLINNTNDIKGIYAFCEVNTFGTIPVYLGISGTIIRRLKQHGWGKKHNEASLAYLMARHKINHTGKRTELPVDEIETQQKIIREFKVSIIPEMDDYKLYFLEVYMSGVFKTKWNSFKTH